MSHTSVLDSHDFVRAPIARSRALALLGASALTLAPSRLFAQTLPLRVSTATSDSYGEAFYALDGGFFARAGLDVTLAIFGNGAESLTSVVSGNSDVGVTNPVSLAQAVQHGLSVTAFAGGCYYVSAAPTTGLMVARDGPIKSAKDLDGRTVALLSIKDFSVAALYEWLAEHGADPATVRVIEVPGSAMSAAVLRGTVAAASIPEPYIAGAKGELRMLGKQFDAIAKRFYIDVWVASPAFIQGHRDAVRRFADAIYATARWANANHALTAPILAARAKLEPAVIAAMTRATYAYGLDVADLQPPLDAAYKYKIIPQAVDARTLMTRV